MRALIVYGLLSIMLGNVLTSIAAAEKIEPTVQPAQQITLVSEDNQKVGVPTEIARLSTTIQNVMEDLPKEKEIPLPSITNRSLSNIISLMKLANSLQNVPFAERLNKLTARINKQLAKSDLQTWENLLHIIDYLNIEILKAPLANGMIRYIHALRPGHNLIESLDLPTGSIPEDIKRKLYSSHAGDRYLINEIVSRLHISDEFKGLLAKYWHLNFGTIFEYILQGLDYGFSIEELAAFNKLPKIMPGEEGAETLNLSGLKINDLTGLNSIPAIESSEELHLSYNQLTTLPLGIFDQLNNLQSLNLSFNQLTTLPLGIFDRLNNLQSLSLHGNPLAVDQKAELKKKLGNKVHFIK